MENIELPRPNTNESYQKLKKFGIEVSMQRQTFVPAKMPKSFKLAFHHFKENILGGDESRYYVVYNGKTFLFCAVYHGHSEGSSEKYFFDESEYMESYKRVSASYQK